LSGAALALTLGAAALHAAWNTAVAGRDDPEAASAALLVSAIGLLAVPAVVFWDVSSDAWPYVVASSVLHAAYFGGLAAAYARADLSVVYPVARGVGPVIVLVVGLVVLGAVVSAGQVVGVLLVCVGVLMVRGVSGEVGLADLALALFVAACIGGYTLVDNEGVEHAAEVSYLFLINAGMAVLYVPLALRMRGGEAIRAEMGARSLLGGAAAMGAYLLVLTALTLAPAAPVAAVRESSVVMAAVLAWVVLEERVTPARFLGAIAVAGGVAAIALS
jgi:drug/metabolite transporter (DMT)-like permease